MSDFYYLNVRLTLQRSEEVTPSFFKKNVHEAVKKLFGDIGAAPTIDVLKFNPQSLEAILRVPKTHYVKVRASLTLSGHYEGQPCIYHIQKSSLLLLSLLGDSRSYIH